MHAKERTKRGGLFVGMVVVSALLLIFTPGAYSQQQTFQPSSQPVKGTLVLDVTPPGAILTLDGVRMGSAKDFRRDLSPGSTPHRNLSRRLCDDQEDRDHTSPENSVPRAASCRQPSIA